MPQSTAAKSSTPPLRPSSTISSFRRRRPPRSRPHRLLSSTRAREPARRRGDREGWIRLDEALELTLLIAEKNPRRHQRVAARWLLRYLEERPEATVEEAAMAASCLAALAGQAHEAAAAKLRAMALEATKQRRTPGVA